MHINSSRRSRFFISLLAASLGASFLWNTYHFLFFGRYLGLPLADNFLFRADDGWCRTILGEGFGNHCFGDYWLTSLVSVENNPWSNNGVVSNFSYTAASLIPFSLLKNFETWVNVTNAGLAIFVFLSAASLSYPAYWATRSLKLPTKILAVSLSLISAPALFVLDRGNSIALAATPLLWFLDSFIKGDIRKLSWSIVLLTFIKPHFIILILAFFVIKKYRQLLLTFILIVGSQILSFLFWPTNFPGTIAQAVTNIMAYGDDWEFSDVVNENLSLVNGLVFFLRILSPDFEISKSNASTISLILLVFMVIAIISARKSIYRFEIAALLFVVAAFSPTITWTYYSIIAIPMAAYMLRSEIDPDFYVAARRSFSRILAFVLTMNLTLFIFVGTYFGVGFPPSSMSLLAPAWFVFAAFGSIVVLIRPPVLEAGN